jgi:hypothetical protein
MALGTRCAPLPLVVIGVKVPEDGWAFFLMPIVLILAKFMLPADAPSFLWLPLLCYLWRIKVAPG